MRKLPIIIFVVISLAQWAVPGWQVWTHEQVLRDGTLIKLKCRAPDPYDPLRGRFLAVSPEQRSAPSAAGEQLRRGQEVYALMAVGDDGLASVSGLSTRPPPSGEFVRVKLVDGGVGGMHRFDWPFDRFYLNEKLGPEADRWFAENVRSSEGIVAEVRVVNGEAVLTDLSFDGRSFREIVEERARQR